MAILYVLKIKDSDFTRENSDNFEQLEGTTVSSVVLNGSNNVTTQEPSLSSGTVMTTLKPHNRAASSSRSSSPDVLPTKHSGTQYNTDKRSLLASVGPSSPKLSPTTNGNFHLVRVFNWGSRSCFWQILGQKRKMYIRKSSHSY